MIETGKATYTFNELMLRINGCEDEAELRLYSHLINEEKNQYCVFFVKVLAAAIAIKELLLIKEKTQSLNL